MYVLLNMQILLINISDKTDTENFVNNNLKY